MHGSLLYSDENEQSAIAAARLLHRYLNGPCAVHVIHFAADYHISLRTPKATLELQYVL